MRHAISVLGLFSALGSAATAQEPALVHREADASQQLIWVEVIRDSPDQPLRLGPRHFALLNLALVAVWAGLALAIGRRYERLVAATP